MAPDSLPNPNGVAERLERKLAAPVIVAALVSVPAVFMTRMDGAVSVAGDALNWASMLVLTGESIVLFLLAGDRIGWLWKHKWVIAVAIAAVPAVIFSLGPVQALRIIRLVGALRVLRASRILTAGRVLRRRMGLDGWWGTALVAGASVLAAVFVGVVLSDPTSQTRELLSELPPVVGVIAAVAAGVILFGATVVVLRNRRRG
jgi:hypothetical protein